MPTATAVRVAGRELSLSNLDKVLYPAAGFTKGDVIQYYIRISPVLLPHLSIHPVTMKRYPNGVRGEFFYEKRCPVYRPSWMSTSVAHESSSEKGDVSYCMVDSLSAVVWVANLASIEFHTLLCTREDPELPTMMVFDLDPGPGASIIDCCWAGLELRKRLKALKLEAFPKTSGGKGLHLCVPLNTPADFDRTKAAARRLAELLEEEFPARVTSNMQKVHRQGRVFIDWSQNDRHKTTVCVYSLRAKELPAVSVPVSWDEVQAALRRKKPELLSFGPEEALTRAERKGDLFAEVLRLKQRLPG